MLGVVAAVFGLLLAFVIIIAYQDFLEADENVSREASALSAIVRDSAAFPEPGGSNARRAVGTYVHVEVDDEWPQLRDGRDSDVAHGGLDGIYAACRTVAPTSAVQTAFYDDAVRQLNDALDARRNRLQTAVGRLPWDIAALILFSSFVVVAYSVLVGSPNFWFHLLGPAAIAAVVIVSLLVLVDLSYLFSGDFAIPPDDFDTGALELVFLRGSSLATGSPASPPESDDGRRRPIEASNRRRFTLRHGAILVMPAGRRAVSAMTASHSSAEDEAHPLPRA
jgi:hypothetical protein